MESAKTPKDKYNMIYITLVFHGLGTLIAWNMFITAKDYFVQLKLANTEYSHNFLAHLGLASQLPNLGFNWLNVFIRVGGNLTVRILVSLTMEMIIFIITIVLAMLDCTEWPGVFFWFTMISVFFLNGFNAIYQNSLFGVAAHLPPKYMGALILGANICGTLVVLLSWLSQSFHNLRTSAIYYFMGGMFVLMVCFDSYFALPITKFFRHYAKVRRAPDNPTYPVDVPYRTILKQSSVHLYNIFITFFVSLSVFPAVISDIQPITEGFLGNNFVLITCFLTFNTMAMIGSVTASLCQIPGPRILHIFTTVRLLFIPFFVLCNYQPPEGRSMAVLVKNDWVYWFVTALLGWSSGHASSLALMYVTSTVAPEQAAKAGMIGAAMIMTGISTGIIFTRLCPIIVK